MLKLSQSFTEIDVLSLRTGGVIAATTKPIINPNNLKVEGWYVVDRFSGSTLVLLSSDIRDMLPQGLVVNDHEALSEAEDLVRLHDILSLRFELLGKPVVSEKGSRLGKVSDYAVETSSLIIKKLYVSQPLIKNFSGGTLSVDRTQIIEITNRRIIIEDPSDKARVRAVVPSVAN